MNTIKSILMILLVSITPNLVVYAAAITVTSTADTVTTGCTLRLAIIAANSDSAVGECDAGSGADEITFSVSGTINLVASLPAITDEITINGFSTTDTVIDGQGEHRIFQIDADHSPSELAATYISNITLTRGFSDIASGALAVRPGNGVAVTNTTIINNRGAGGGGISLENTGSEPLGTILFVISSNIESNISTGPAGGGGIRAGAGSRVLILSSSIVGNRSDDGGGGLLLFGSNSGPSSLAEIANSTFSGNTTTGNGGGIWITGIDSRIYILSSTIASNVADSDLNSPIGSTRDGGGGLYAGPGTHNTLQNSIIARNVTGFSADDIYSVISVSPTSFTTEGANLIGTNRSVSTPFPAGLPNSNNDYVGTTENTLNAASMLGPLAFDESSQTNFRPLESTSLARDNGGQCNVETDQLERSRSICKCDIGAYEFFESSPDNNSCRSSFFVIPLPNGKSVIVDL